LSKTSFNSAFAAVVVGGYAPRMMHGRDHSEPFILEDEGEQPRRRRITQNQWKYREPVTIPPREFLRAGHYIREYLSSTIGAGGLGKTSLQLIEAIGMVTGRDLLKGTSGLRPMRVWYWNLEDPHDEIDGRIAAILIHYRVGTYSLSLRSTNKPEALS
jgi:RecA-family ATPase